MNPTWARAQNWREHLPEPGIVGAAARDFAREAAAFPDAGAVDDPPTDQERRNYEEALIDAYITGALEMSKAVSSGAFAREPWRSDGDSPSSTVYYRDWFASIPHLSLAEHRAEASDAPALSPVAETQRLVDQFRGQRCEAYGRLLFTSLLRWSAADSWRHMGQVTAIWHETREYFPHRFLHAYMFVVSSLRSRYAPTWNDYYASRWFLRRDAVHVLELHRRSHLKGAKWAPVASSAAWCVNSLRKQYPEFDRDFRAVVHCDECAEIR